MYQHIYFHVALQSAGTFKQLVKIIPDLYRWFKRVNNRVFIEGHFIYYEITASIQPPLLFLNEACDMYGPVKSFSYVSYSTKIDGQYHSFDNKPAHIKAPARFFEISKLSYSSFFSTLREKKVSYYRIEWYRYGCLHRDNGFAVINYVNDLPGFNKIEYCKEKYINGTYIDNDNNIKELIGVNIINPVIWQIYKFIYAYIWIKFSIHLGKNIFCDFYLRKNTNRQKGDILKRLMKEHKIEHNFFQD